MLQKNLDIRFLAAALCIFTMIAAVPVFAQPEEQENAEQVQDAMRNLLEQIEQGEFGPESGQHVTADGNVVNPAGDVVIEQDQTVEGDAVAIGGGVEVHGTVEGNVVSLGGPCRLAETANVAGDVMAIGGAVERHDGAVVGGSKVQIDAPWVEAIVAQFHEQIERGAEPPDTWTSQYEDTTGQEPGREEEERAEAEEIEQLQTGDGIVRFGEDVTIEDGRTVDEDVVVFGGDVHVAGTLDGDVVAIDGAILVGPEGTVDGDIVAIGRDVILESGARVTGDVVTLGGKLEKAEGATVGGTHQTVGWRSRVPDMDEVQRPFSRLGRRVLNAFAFLVLLLILVVAVPKQMNAVATRISEEPGRAILYGLIGLLLVLPILVVMVFMVITWALIPLFIAAVAGLGLVGMVGIDILIGRKLAGWMRLSTGSLIGMAILGYIILAVAGMLAELPVVGAAGSIFLLAVFVFGFGGALMTGFGADPSGTWLFGPTGDGPQGPPPDGPQGGPTPQSGADVEPPQPSAGEREMAGEPLDEPQTQSEAGGTPRSEVPPEPEDLSDMDADETYRPDEHEPDLPEEDVLKTPPEESGAEETYETPPDESGWEDPEE